MNIFRKTSSILRHSFLPLLGLTIALSASLLIMWVISWHLTFDHQHTKRDSIYRVSMQLLTGESEDHYATTGGLLGPELSEKYAAVEDHVSFKLWDGPGVISRESEELGDYKIFGVNQSVFRVFDYTFIEGGPNALDEPSHIVISEQVAETAFGNQSPINKRLNIDGTDFTVTGVIQNLPSNTDPQFDILVAYQENITEEEILQSFFNIDHYTYVLAGQQSGPSEIRNALDNYAGEFLNPLIKKAGAELTVDFQAMDLNRIHLSEALMMDTPKGNRSELYILGGLTVLLLVIGIANYLNAVLAGAFRKARKIGMQRVLGVSKQMIRLHAIGESLVITTLSVVIAGGVAWFCLRYLAIFSDFDYSPDLQTTGVLLSVVFLIVLLGSSLGGLAPVNMMCRIAPADLLKGKRTLLSYNSINQRLVLFLQFAVSFLLITCTFELSRQFNYFNQQERGFNDEQIVVVNVPSGDNQNMDMQRFRDQLLSNSAIANVSLTRIVPGDQPGQEIFSINEDGNSREVVFNYVRVDENYFNVLGIPIKEGRIFNRESDDNAFLANESFVSNLTGIDPFQVRIEYDTLKQVIGIVGDYHQLSFHNPIEPMLFGKLDPESDQVNKVLISAPQGSLALIRQTWEELGLPGPFDYYYLDEYFESQYRQEAVLLKLFTAGSAIAICLSCLGLFSLMALVIRNRKQELAVRQVLGSSFRNNFLLLSKPYYIMLAIVTAIGVPVAYKLTGIWKESYAYISDSSPVIYIGTLGIILFMITGIVLYHLNAFGRMSIIELINEE